MVLGTLKLASAQTPDDLDLRIARSALRSGDTDKAISFATKVLDRAPTETTPEWAEALYLSAAGHCRSDPPTEESRKKGQAQLSALDVNLEIRRVFGGTNSVADRLEALSKSERQRCIYVPPKSTAAFSSLGITAASGGATPIRTGPIVSGVGGKAITTGEVRRDKPVGLPGVTGEMRETDLRDLQIQQLQLDNRALQLQIQRFGAPPK